MHEMGSLYGSDYVNDTIANIKKNISDAFRFVCLTDDCSNLKKVKLSRVQES